MFQKKNNSIDLSMLFIKFSFNEKNMIFTILKLEMNVDFT